MTQTNSHNQLICLLACVASFCWASSSTAQSAGWKFAEGDSFAINIKQASTVKTVVDRRVVDQSNELALEIHWSVESMDGENAKITQTISRVVSSLTIPGKQGVDTPQTIEYDSNNEKHKGDARRMHASFSRIVDQPVTITMTPGGEIIDVDVPESTLESLRQMPGSMQGRKMFELESIREMFANAGLQVPTDGKTEWQTTRDFDIGTPQKFNQTLDYTIADSESDPLEIKFTGTVAVADPTAETERPEGIEFDSLEIEDQSSGGTIKFDSQAGNCTSSEATTMIKTRTAYRDMQVVATINSTVEMTVQRN